MEQNVNPKPVQPQAQPQQNANTPDANDVQQNKAMAILAYLGILVLVPIFAAKESKFARFHANQGLILLICSVGLWIVVEILVRVFLHISFGLLFLTGLLSFAMWVVIVVFSIIGIVNAAKGQCKELPLIGKFQILK